MHLAAAMQYDFIKPQLERGIAGGLLQLRLAPCFPALWQLALRGDKGSVSTKQGWVTNTVFPRDNRLFVKHFTASASL
jgi:hypothetical protein